MSTVGKSIVVLGGEPSSATTTVNDLGILYLLDTTKIRYPGDSSQPGPQRTPQSRRPSGGEVNGPPRQTLSRDGSNGPSDSRHMIVGGPSAPPNGHRSPPHPVEGHGPPTKLPRAGTGTPPAIGPPPPRGHIAPKPTVDTAIGRIRGQSSDRSTVSGSPKVIATQSPILRDVINENDSPVSNGRRTPTQTQQAPRSGSRQEIVNGDVAKSKPPRPFRAPGSVDSSTESVLKTVVPRPASPPPPTRQPSNPLSRRSSGRNSQTVTLLKELDSSRNRNAWYASELELARKAGYIPNASWSPVLDSKATETFDDEDRPLIEALLAMRTELANVQSAVDKQAVLAAKQIGEAEAQRNAAVQEAVYAKAKLAAHMGGSTVSTPQLDSERDESEVRSSEIGRKLAAALHLQKDLQSKLDAVQAERDAEKRARQLSDDTSNAAQKRMADLENYKQQTSTEVDRLKAELHSLQRQGREQSVAYTEAFAALELLRVEKEDLEDKYEEVVGSSKEHDDTFESLRVAISSSEESRTHLETKLAEERSQREKLETQLNKLKFEHEARTAELVAATQRLRDAEELSEKHAAEARTHRQAVVSGLDKISARSIPQSSTREAERVVVLQNQVSSASDLVRKYQKEADTAADKLRSAEERIAGLEQYQEQSSREGVSIRRQLQSALRDTQSLQASNTDLKNKLAAQQLETNAMTVQHNALKDILGERGISPTGAIRARGLSSPRMNSPDVSRTRDLEAQLTSANTAHEETRQAFAIQAQESEATYREKLSQLESDYQSAVHYVKGTEKMLKQLKDQLIRYKTDNARLKSEIEDLEDQLQVDADKPEAPADWEGERAALEAKIGNLEAELKTSGAQLQRNLDALKADLQASQKERDEALKNNAEAKQRLHGHSKDLEQLHSENSLLEQRATDAERKVALLLDQVEHSVDNYRRRSRQVPSMNSDLAARANGLDLGHARNESSEAESVYDDRGGHAPENRNSAALDSLANELETLRTHWEATNKNYRLSTNFDFEPSTGKKEADTPTGTGLSESLADWRKRLDTDEHSESDTKTKPKHP